MKPSVRASSVDGLRQELKALRRQVQDLHREQPWQYDPPETVTPVPFHWPGQVDRFIDLRNGPGEFGAGGLISRIRYRWDTPAAAGATVEWELDGVNVGTHTVTSANPHIELPGWTYSQEAIVAIVTAVGSDASGLTAFVYLDA